MGHPFKRNLNPIPISVPVSGHFSAAKTTPRRPLHHRPPAARRRLTLLFVLFFAAVVLFGAASLVLQSSVSGMFGREREGKGGGGTERVLGSSLRFVGGAGIGSGVDRGNGRVGVRPPRLALVLGNMKTDPVSLMLYTVAKNLRQLGYVLKIYAVEDGESRSIWEKIGGRISILTPERYDKIDWSIYEGIIVNSPESKEAISSLMQEPFCSVPLIWIIQDDTLANRLPVYEDMGWEHLILYWKNAFSRADVVVFPDFSLPMLYSVLDTGNFFVNHGSPVDVWAAESYHRTHSKFQLRKENGFSEDDFLVLIVGSTFFYNDLSGDYAVAMHDLGPLITKYARERDSSEAFNFLFLCGNSTDEYDDALQNVATQLGLIRGSLRHYGMNGDVNGLLLMADIVLYAPSQDEQGFPALLTRAMTFGIPVVAPDVPVIKKYVVDGEHGMLYPKHKPDELLGAFSNLVSNGKITKFANAVASTGKLLAKDMQASDCIHGFAQLLESVLAFPSDSLLPDKASQVKGSVWEWKVFKKQLEGSASDRENIDQNGFPKKIQSVVSALEKVLTDSDLNNDSESGNDGPSQDNPTELDWEILMEIENSEEVERLEMEEIEGRKEKDPGVWDEIYRNARKAEKLKFEANEMDEGELERTGQKLCIYEVYDGIGAWPHLHHGSLYRGLTLSPKARRLRSDDVNAVGRLPLLNDSYYRDIFCEIGGMFAIANGVDNIHKRPWIGFQSWRADGRKVSLSPRSEQVLETIIQERTKGDVMYFWARLDLSGESRSNDALTFWSMCDILNVGNCRRAFEDAFRRMYGLPSDVEALPPMPEDGGHWSAMHSWVMPTPSFLEFVMFSRIFADSLNGLHTNSSRITSCLLGSSELEEKHCYCRILELLVNVWAYHSARRMVYIDPHTGSLEEQHPVAHRNGLMWVKYFNFTLLKSMDEDLAEAADDTEQPNETWLWPLTGEVYWQGIYEREREERYRLKMDKKRKIKEKLFERLKKGYKQKTLGG